MNWRVGIRRMTGKKAEPVATLEVNAAELEAIAEAIEDPNADPLGLLPDLPLDLRAAGAGLERLTQERARG